MASSAPGQARTFTGTNKGRAGPLAPAWQRRAVKAGKIRDCISTGTVQPQKQTNSLKRKELTPDQSSSFSPSTPLAIAGGLHADMRKNNSRNNNSNDNHLSAPQYSRSYCKSS
jgi:hypothetical protein